MSSYTFPPAAEIIERLKDVGIYARVRRELHPRIARQQGDKTCSPQEAVWFLVEEIDAYGKATSNQLFARLLVERLVPYIHALIEDEDMRSEAVQYFLSSRANAA